MKAISVSGSRNGMNDMQFMNLQRVVLWDLRGFFQEDIHVHHGDCVGVDEAVHDFFQSLKKDHLDTSITIHAHPGLDHRGLSPYRAYCPADVIYQPLPYRERNQIMVSAGDVELIVSNSMSSPRPLGSGTWMSYRMARKEQAVRQDGNYFIYVFWPNGTTERLNYTSTPDWEK